MRYSLSSFYCTYSKKARVNGKHEWLWQGILQQFHLIWSKLQFIRKKAVEIASRFMEWVSFFLAHFLPKRYIHKCRVKTIIIMQLDMQKSLQIVTRLFCNFSGHKENYEKEGVIYRFDTAKLAEVEKSDVLFFYLRKISLCSDFT